MKKLRGIFFVLLFFVGIPLGRIGLAQDNQLPIIQIPITSPDEIASREPQTGENLSDYIKRVGFKGPAKIVMKQQASFDLPKGYLFVPDKSASVLLYEIDGSKPLSEVMGLIFPENEELGYILLEYYSIGYLKDNNSNSVDAAQWMAQMKGKTEAENHERKEGGSPEVKILDWVEKPSYDSTAHRITWSVLTGDPSDAKNQGINYSTALLGRRGYFNMLLVTNSESFKTRSSEIALLLSTFNFNQGNRYSDFVATTDSIANCNLNTLLTECSPKK
jgi:uncharacterized membrane-anchored protein